MNRRLLNGLSGFREEIERSRGKPARLAFDLAFTLQECYMILCQLEEAISLEAPELIGDAIFRLGKKKDAVEQIAGQVGLAPEAANRVVTGMGTVAGDGFDTVEHAKRETEDLLDELWSGHCEL